MKFYVYEWFIKDTDEIFYVGKGCRRRYRDMKSRNQIFLDIVNNNNCDSRIIQYFENENDALKAEHERIIELKEKGLCKANLDDGGYGGLNFVWTNEMREYKSKYNPMKEPEQRKRMSEKNPMKNPEIAKKAGKKHRRAVIINGQYFDGVKIAAKHFNVHEQTVSSWCKRGYNTNGEPCRYADEEQKEYPSYKKTHPKVTTRKPVIIDRIHFDTVKDGAEYIGCSSSLLIKALKEHKTCKGHTCEYDNQQPSHENIE